MFKIFLMGALLSTALFAEVKIKNAYIPLPATNAKNAGVFMEIHNLENKKVIVDSAKSSVSRVTELHTHTKKDGMMMMVQVPHFSVEPNAVLELKRGGNHIMLIGLDNPLKEGDFVDVEIHLSDGTSIKENVQVIKTSQHHKHHK